MNKDGNRLTVTTSKTRWWGCWLSSGDDENPHNSLTVIAGRYHVSLRLPRIIPPYREKVVARYWDAATIARLGRDWYWHTDRREFGVSLMDGHLSVRYGRQADDSKTDRQWGCFLPWTQWRFVRFSLYDLAGQHFWTRLNDRGGVKGWEEQRDAVARVPKARFMFDDFDGKRIEATTHIEEREWTLGTGWCSWLRFFTPNKVRRSLDIAFSEEVGPEKGSWKGGTTGHSIDMLPGESHEAAFRRYCEQDHHSKSRRFRIRFVARLAVEQDRARREKREPHRALLALQKDGYVDVNSDDDHAQHLIVLRWTPKRVWIESEKNRELARILRKHYYNSELAFDVADDLDGGKR